MSSFTSYESSTGQSDKPSNNDFNLNLSQHRADVNQYVIDKKNGLDTIENEKISLDNAFYNKYVVLTNSSAIFGWIRGVIDSINRYNSEVRSYNNTYVPNLKYATLNRKADGEYYIKYDSDLHYLYSPTEAETPPYYKGVAATGGKRIKSKKRTKSRKSKKLKKKSKTHKR